MALIAETKWATLNAEQISCDERSATYKATLARKGNSFWGTSDYIIKMYSGDDYIDVLRWCCPRQSGWKRDGSTRYLMQDGVRQKLSWHFWDCTDANPQRDSSRDKPHYDQEPYLLRLYESWEDTYTVNIDRGNARQGTKTITIGCNTGTTSHGWTDCYGQLTLTTAKIADVSGVNFNVSVDPKDRNPRYINISASFTNPESYYTAYITGPDGFSKTITSQGSWAIPVTYAMFNTNRTYTITIKGKDNTIYKTESKSTGNIEPHGVGIWYKQNNQPKECYHVYYKNDQGNIIEVTEAWYRRNSLNIKTVK